MHAHIVAIYGSLLGLLFIYLSLQTVKQRRSEKVEIGMGEGQGLARAARAHANFSEYVPLALILLLILEQTAFPHWVLHILAGLLLIGRCLHAWGFSRYVGVSFGRFWGTLLTWTVLFLSAAFNLYYAILS